MSFVGSINDNPRREWAPATRRVIYLIAKVPGRLSMPLPHPPTSASSVVAAEIYNVSIDDIILLSRRRQPIQPTIMDMLTQAEQRQLEQRMQKRQVQEFMTAFGGLVDHCFVSCVDDFTSKALSSRESGCINRCVLKWMATQQRVSDRFQEHNQNLAQQQANQAGR